MGGVVNVAALTGKRWGLSTQTVSFTKCFSIVQSLISLKMKIMCPSFCKMPEIGIARGTVYDLMVIVITKVLSG